ncbi:MAG: peptidylprolyl isomerase [Sphingomonadaceae bacterium]|nr:peptidylprolyl isomerase [Sphingomonadaceae bacterium]
MRTACLAALALTAAAPLPPAPPPPLPGEATPSEVIAAAPAEAWREVAPENLVLLTLAGGGRVAIELAAAQALRHVQNLKKLIAARWWDGQTAVVRVQDNYVTQWGDPGNTRPLPEGVTPKLPLETLLPEATAFDPIPGPDGYGEPGFVNGFPAARKDGRRWLVHCYGAVGVGRDASLDSGNASELYTTIGHSPRNLDRNYTVIGRVVGGMERLSSLPRGTGALGFYETPEQQTKIGSVRLASELPPAERPRFEVFRSGTPSFAALVRARAFRRDFANPPGFVDLCNVRPPARAVAGSPAL